MIDDPQIINAIHARLDETYLSETVLALPSRYDLAVSAACDIKCPFCPRQKFGSLVESGFLKPEVFDAVLPYLKYSRRTGLYGQGEPFLNKKFFDYLMAAKAGGSPTFTSSHGMSLTEDVCRRLIEYQLDELAVSIDGCTRKVFEFLRAGADFRKVCENVRRLAAMKKSAGADKPLLSIACAVSRYNVHQMAGMILLAKRLGVNRIAFSNIIMVKEEDARHNAAGTRAFRFHWAAARRLARFLRIEALYFYQNPFPWKPEPRSFPPGSYFGCPAAWGQLVVEKDGNLKPCCYLEDSLGNAVEPGGIGLLYNGEGAKALRQTFLSGQLKRACRECGMLMQNCLGHTEQCLRQASEQIAAAELSPSVREDLLAKLRDYRAKAENK